MLAAFAQKNTIKANVRNLDDDPRLGLDAAGGSDSHRFERSNIDRGLGESIAQRSGELADDGFRSAVAWSLATCLAENVGAAAGHDRLDLRAAEVESAPHGPPIRLSETMPT